MLNFFLLFDEQTHFKSTMYNKLLERQLNRYIKNKDLYSSEWKSLFDAISLSYDHYEQDHMLAKRSLEISSQEQRIHTIKIQEREEKIRAILEAASDGIIVVNEAYKIEIYNSVAASILNIDKANAASLDLFAIQVGVYGNFGSLSNSNEIMSLANFLSDTKTFKLYEISIFNPNGSILPVEVSASDISNASEKLKICILRNITLRKELEQKINFRMEITHLLLESNSLDQVLPQLISKMTSKFGWDIGSFWLNDVKTNEMYRAYIFSVETTPLLNEFIDHYRQMIYSSANESWDDFKTNNRPYFNNQLQEKSLCGDNEFDKYGLCSCLIVPVALKNNIFGIIELFSLKRMEKRELLLEVFSYIGIEIAMFIDRQQAVNRELELQKKFIEAAREAGKSQIATNVLHNVGNALNTLNTSISIFNENFKKSELDNLLKVANLLKQHSEDLISFLSQDPKGKHLPEYIIALARWWTEEKGRSTQELEKLTSNLEHIKSVISSQQRFSGIAGIKDKIHINDLLDDIVALKVREGSNKSISFIRRYDELPFIEIDKVKFLQILYNLLCNAIDAVNEKNPDSKIITLKTEVSIDKKIRIHIIDNGCGIDPENAVKIFSYGFTTKKDGHGFGLHSSSILAEEMDGNLRASSLGTGKGAEFILTIPL
jgi:signal transduction histidine kinase/PAS domain-containing protein